jgi:cytosine/adenosine deaminase-related metal-dependent hydrolase
MNQFTLRARWVLPIDSPPIEGGYVGVADGKIATVGATNPNVGAATDLGDAVLMPGLVNAHTHLEFSGAERPLGAAGMTLPEWIRLVIADRKRSNRDAAASALGGLRESLAAGVTTIGEIATSVPDGLSREEIVPRAVVFQEAIGFSAGRVESVFADVKQRLYDTAEPLGVSPHAPYTVHPRLLTRLVGLARERYLPVAMHLAESREELRLLERGDGPFRELLEERSMWDAEAIPRGSRPLDYLKELAEAPRSLIIHGNYLDAEEIGFVGGHRARISVVFCPRTHAYFQHEAYPLAEMLKAGVRVALGTDSRASNPDLSLLEEVRLLAKQFPFVSPMDALRMATRDGAEALGQGSVSGSLKVGKRADLVALEIGDQCEEPFEAVLACGKPLVVWIDGRTSGGV